MLAPPEVLFLMQTLFAGYWGKYLDSCWEELWQAPGKPWLTPKLSDSLRESNVKIGLNKLYIKWTQWGQKQLDHLVGVKPSEAALSEQDFMQSNGEEVEEPSITKVWHDKRSLSSYWDNPLGIKMEYGSQGGAEETSQWRWKGAVNAPFWHQNCTKLKWRLHMSNQSVSHAVAWADQSELDMTLDWIRMDRWRQEGSAEVRREGGGCFVCATIGGISWELSTPRSKRHCFNSRVVLSPMLASVHLFNM